MVQALVAKEAVDKAPDILNETRKTLTFVAWGVVGVVAVFVAYKLSKGAISKLSNIFSEEAGGGLSDLLKQKTNDGSTRPTIGNAEAISLANGQEEGMRGINDFGSMYNSLLLLNGKDLQLVAQKFGRRDIATFGVNNVDLFTWYKDQLGDNQLTQMRTLWNKSGLAF